MRKGSKILVSGLVNMETSVKIPGFPLDYAPIYFNFFGVNSSVSGVGVNLAKALTALGDNVNLVSLSGKDTSGSTVKSELESAGISTKYILSFLKSTPQSVVLYDDSGRRQIHCDLKNLQDTEYPKEQFLNAMENCQTLALCNINFSRRFLKIARDAGKTVATDVHVIGDVNDKYNADFMKYSDILFMSDENIKEPVKEFVKKIAAKYGSSIIAVGMGEKGSFLYVKADKFFGEFPAVKAQKIISTIGAGDALFSAFLHCYNETCDPYISIKKANIFASCKIGTACASEGFISSAELDKLYNKLG